MTHGDRIRSMTDAELASEIIKTVGNLKKCKFCTRYREICDKRVNCQKHVAEWLRKDEKDDDQCGED